MTIGDLGHCRFGDLRNKCPWSCCVSQAARRIIYWCFVYSSDSQGIGDLLVRRIHAYVWDEGATCARVYEVPVCVHFTLLTLHFF